MITSTDEFRTEQGARALVEVAEGMAGTAATMAPDALTTGYQVKSRIDAGVVGAWGEWEALQSRQIEGAALGIQCMEAAALAQVEDATPERRTPGSGRRHASPAICEIERRRRAADGTEHRISERRGVAALPIARTPNDPHDGGKLCTVTGCGSKAATTYPEGMTQYCFDHHSHVWGGQTKGGGVFESRRPYDEAYEARGNEGVLIIDGVRDTFGIGGGQ